MDSTVDNTINRRRDEEARAKLQQIVDTAVDVQNLRERIRRELEYRGEPDIRGMDRVRVVIEAPSGAGMITVWQKERRSV